MRYIWHARSDLGDRMTPTQREIHNLAKASTYIESSHTARSVGISVNRARHLLRAMTDAGYLNRYRHGFGYRYTVRARCPHCGREL